MKKRAIRVGECDKRNHRDGGGDASEKKELHLAWVRAYGGGE